MALLCGLLWQRIGLTALTVLTGLLSTAVSIGWNVHLGGMIDSIGAGLLLTGTQIGWALFFWVVTTAVAWALELCIGWTCETLAHDLRMGYARRLMDLSPAQMQDTGAGAVLSGLQNEIPEIATHLRTELFAIAMDGIRLLGTLAWMLRIAPGIALLSNLPVALLLLYTIWSSRLIGVMARRSQQANEQMNGHAQTLLAVFPVIRLFDAAALFQRQYAAALDAWVSASIREERRRAVLMSLSAMIAAIPMLLLLGVGGLSVIRGTLSLGMLYAFVNLSGNVSGTLMNMPGRIAVLRRFAANLDRIAPSVQLQKGGVRHGH